MRCHQSRWQPNRGRKPLSDSPETVQTNRATSLTIKHEELKSLDMPAMTMVFVVADESMIEEVKVGQKIEFTADRVNGRITVTEIKK